MKYFITISLLLFNYLAAQSQQVSYTGVSKKEIASRLNFEIIGKVGKNYLVFKRNDFKNIIQVFDNNLAQLSYSTADFLPEDTRSKTFITYPTHVMAICEYIADQQAFIAAIKLDEYGEKTGSMLLDSGRAFNVVYSENKQLLLLYMFERDSTEKTRIITRLFDADLNRIEEDSSYVKLNPKGEVYNNFLLRNDGTFSFTISRRTPHILDKVNMIDIMLRKPKTSRYIRVPLGFGKYYCGPLQISADNVNNKYIINSFFSPQTTGEYQLGLFTAVMNGNNYNVNSRFLYFTKELLKTSDTSNPAVLFKDFFLQQVLLKKDGSFIAIAEKIPKQKVYTAQPPRYAPVISSKLYDPFMQNWLSRQLWHYPDRNSTISADGYYLKDLFNEILILDIGSDLQLKKSELISKKQNGDFDNASYGMINRGQQLDFLYLDDLKQMQIVNSRTFTSDGKLNNNPTLRTYEKGHRFMPRLMKQISATEALIPTTYKGRVAFARIKFE